jgi:transcriptional regulator with XRE-family HTH domain
MTRKERHLTDRDKAMREALANGVRERRRLLGLSQDDIESVSAWTIMSIEGGRHDARPSTLRRIAQAFGCEVADLYQEPDLPKEQAPRSGLTVDSIFAEIGVWVNLALQLKVEASELLERRRDAEELERVMQRRYPHVERQMLAISGLKTRDEFNRLTSEDNLPDEELGRAEHRVLFEAEQAIKEMMSAVTRAFERGEELELQAATEGDIPEHGGEVESFLHRRLRQISEAS